MGLFDIPALPDELKKRIDALIEVGANIATGLDRLSGEVSKLTKEVEKKNAKCSCDNPKD
jgi:hypothetical protein